MEETTILLDLLKGLGPTASVLLFIVWLLIRDKREKQNGDGTDPTTLQSLATTQELMAHTIGLIEKDGSVPFQVHVAENRQKMKSIGSKIGEHEKRLDDQSGRLDAYDEGQGITVHILKDIVKNHNRMHPEAPLTGPD